MAATYEPESPSRSRPRPRSRMMSWGSGGRSAEDPRARVDMTESPRDKARSRMSMNTKADPNKAIGELQPGQVQFEEATLDSIRGMQHKDTYGNVITDPDRSNPTRPRMERPLDTIRSFEAAAEGPYNRKYPPRPETAEPMGYSSRRSSYHQAYGPMQNRYQEEGYGRGYSGHPAVNGNYGGANNHGYSNGSRSPAPLRRMPPRAQSEQMMYNEAIAANGQYQYQHQHSYETATNGSGSGHSYGTEPWANSTDPSSQNSSFDRLQQVPPPLPKADMGDQYGFQGFGTGPDLQQRTIMEEQQGYDGYAYDAQHQGYEYDQQAYAAHQGGYYEQAPQSPQSGGGMAGMAPPPPPHASKPGVPRAPSKLQSSRRQPQQQQQYAAPTSPQEYDAYGAPIQPEGAEKRKSWLKRRFSKNGA